MTDDHAFLADCRARLAFDLLGNTWNSVLLWTLRDGPSRPGALRERIGGISQKVLTETLRRLEFNGLVERRAHGGSPPRVEYGLTPGEQAPAGEAVLVGALVGGGGHVGSLRA
ncbi:helix-turn-helix domain-containing protein [Streptomyces sp. NPDC004546]|uniref:winged helix-turn-helix transcriptional regulator n=1 Tax=unclassified Streptomyces TaxID=2593676 RepID=UPI0033BEA632